MSWVHSDAKMLRSILQWVQTFYVFQEFANDNVDNDCV